MKVPRDISGADLAHALRVLGYTVTRQTGSHLRLTTDQDGLHHETVPKHRSIKVGTLSGILKSISAHHKMSIDELLSRLRL